jgi:hypothetical protein
MNVVAETLPNDGIAGALPSLHMPAFPLWNEVPVSIRRVPALSNSPERLSIAQPNLLPKRCHVSIGLCAEGCDWSDKRC